MTWTHFPLHPDTPAEGRTIEDLFKGRNFDLEAAKTRLAQLMAEEGLPYGDRHMTYNSRLAQELGAWADTQPGGDAIHEALFKAYFVGGVNLMQVDELVRIAEHVGLDGAAAREALTTRAFQERVDTDWRRAAQYRISGVPTFVAGGNGVVGCVPYEVLEQLVRKAGAQPRSAEM